MPRYSVRQYVLYSGRVIVEADSPEEAAEAVARGEGDSTGDEEFVEIDMSRGDPPSIESVEEA